ncbi:MAG: NACHT domain-containing protein [Stigonema ocellatum SAG 48.90 = DSM 106950]|nr:NACHT domain-containing protein [Stigonema ocellatum SAG 48.90 = DSM 106950]
MTGIASPIIKDKLQRNEIVIKLLKQFNLAPEHPPADFSGVYAYALVEYGVGKPRPILELFRLEQIKQAFRKAFDHNNPSILLSEVDTFIEGYALGDEIKTLGIEVRREIATFYIIFSEVAKRSRTPAEVLTNQAIASLHQKIATLTLTLDRLPTIEGIRTEIGRLESQNYPALPILHGRTDNKCRAIALAQQMRGWFETLGYRFEKYELWEDNHFEWIINIPVRRNRYDRILIRGIEGEAGLGDLMALRSSVETQRTDEGWLVTVRRISRAARDEVDQEENRHLACYTFDELIDQDADFSGYLDWLEAEVKRRQIDTKYVPLACTKEEFDPVTQHRMGVSRYDERDRWIDGYIDLWLDDPAKEHISVLGEFGTGKTWFALHYAWVALQRYRDAQKRGTELPRLPLVIPLRDYAKAVSVESLFSEFFFRQYKIPLPHYDAFVQLNRMGKLLLIFDGFDEMAARVDRQEMINNFWELVKVVVPGAKVILTCRTEHFPEAKEGRSLLNAELLASTANLTGETPQFEVLELEKFNDDQIRQVLSLQAQPTTVEQVMGNPQLLDLARRPVMTELILEALPDIEIGKPVDMSRVYLYAVRRKMERDIKAERTFTTFADKLYFLCELSWEMLSTDQMSLNYRLFPDRIRRLFGSMVQEEKDLDHWHFDVMGQTMLIRNAEGDYTPAHRSLLEFFVAYKFAAELGALAEDFTELARAQSCLDGNAAPIDYTWSGYFARQLDGNGRCVAIAQRAVPKAIAPLRTFTSEPLSKLLKTFGRSLLTKAVMDLLLPMLDNHQSLLRIIEQTKGKTEVMVDYVGGNAATLLVKVDQAALEDKDLSSAVIKGADFSNASLRRVNFAMANLTSSVFTQSMSSLVSVKFSPDGEYFATGVMSGEVRLWRSSDLRQLRIFEGHSNWVWAIAFSPDNKLLVSGSGDYTIKVWDIHTGVCLKTLTEHTNKIYSAAFHPNSQLLASGSEDRTIKLWDVNTGNCLKTLNGHTDWVLSVTFNPIFSTTENGLLASSSADGTIKLWDINTGECLRTLKGHSSRVYSVSFSPDGQMLASSSEDQTIKLWDLTTGKYRKSLNGDGKKVYSVRFSPDGKILASCGEDRIIKLWDIDTSKCLLILRGHNSQVCAIAFSPDGRTLISSSDDQTARLWDVATGNCLNVLQGYTRDVYSVAFSPIPLREILASGSDDHMIRIWDLRTGECHSIRGNQGRIRSVAFSPDGQILASGGANNTIKLWEISEISQSKCIKTLDGHTNWVWKVVFSPDGQTLASSSEDQTIRLWDIHTGECLQVLRGHNHWVWTVAFSPDGQILASGSADSTVKLWDVRTGQCIHTFVDHTDLVWSVAFSPDGQFLASGSEDQTVRLWNLSTSECENIFDGHSKQVYSVAFSPDGQILATGSGDTTIKLWQVSAGVCLDTLTRGHTAAIRSVAFSSDGRLLASGSEDENIQLWDVDKCSRLRQLKSDRLYERMDITGITGLTDAEKTSLKAFGAVERDDFSPV